MRRDQRVHRQKAKTGRAIDQDVAERCARSPDRQGVSQTEFPPLLIGEFDFRAHQIRASRDQPQAGEFRLVRVRGVRESIGDQLIAAPPTFPRANTQSGGGISLRVEIDQQDRRPGFRQRGRQVHGRRCLSHAPLLVGDGDDARLKNRMAGAVGFRHA